MPTDTSPAGAMQATWPNDRAALRLAFGTGGLFAAGIVFGWPLSYVGAVFSGLLLMVPQPVPLRRAGLVIAASFAILFGAWAGFSLLLPYPALFLVAICAGVVGALTLSVRGANQALVTLALMAALLIPVLLRAGPDMALAAFLWLPLNMVFAFLSMWLAFAILPAGKAARRHAAEPDRPHFDPARRLLRMSLVSLPFVLGFFLIDGGAVITLLFTAILTQQLAAGDESGRHYVRRLLVANLSGGFAAIVAFQIIAIAPTTAVLTLASLLLCLGFAHWWVRGRREAALVNSALGAALVILGGALAPTGADADLRMLVRLLQIAGALAYTLAAFVVVDAFLPERPIAFRSPDWRGRTVRSGHARRPKAPAHRA